MNSDLCHAANPFAHRALSSIALPLVAVLLLHGFQRPSTACLRPDGSNDEDYLAAGAAMQTNLLHGRVWYTDKATGSITNWYAISAAYYNERYVLTAAHNLFGPNSNYRVLWLEIGTGPNYLTNRGFIVPSFRQLVHPAYDYSDTGVGPDVAIVCLAASLPGANAVIGGVSRDEIVLHGGFGGTATPSSPITYDGNSRGWYAPVDGFVDSRYNPAYYASSRFYDFFHYTPLDGHGLSGDSGGPVFNSAGELIGLNKAQIGGTSSSGATVYVKLAQPDVFSWVVQNTSNVTCNPPALALSSPGSVSLAGDTNQIYGILSSTNLTEWQEIGLVTNLTGTVVFQDPAAASFPNRFYRAVAK